MKPLDEIILLRDFPQEGVYDGDHGILLFVVGDYIVGDFTREDGSVVNLTLLPEDFEFPDFTLEDKEWIDKIKGEDLTIADLYETPPAKKLGWDDWD